MEKINKYIKSLLDKNEKAAKKKKIMAQVAGPDLTEDQMIDQEMKRRDTFSALSGKSKPRTTKATSQIKDSDEDVVTRLALAKRKTQKQVYGKGKRK